MSAKHTPGPWITEKRDGDEWWFGGRDGAEIVIRPSAAEPYYSIAVIGSKWSSDVGEADARLIAAAPDLLEALQDILHGAEAMGWDTSKARAAIAKATGSAS